MPIIANALKEISQCAKCFKKLWNFLHNGTVGVVKASVNKPTGLSLNNWSFQKAHKEKNMSLILIIILILLLVGGLPVFPHSRSWGYGPSGIIGTILVILLILVLLGRI